MRATLTLNRPTETASDELVINDRIRARTVRLVSDDATEVMPYLQAMGRAREANLDLVLISEGEVPVCRLLDADRYRYEKKRVARDQAKRQRALAIEVKEIQLKPNINEHDLSIKAMRAKSFLSEGDKVKIVVRFRGRERAHRYKGVEVIRQLLEKIGDHKLDKPSGNEGDMIVIIAPMQSKADILRSREKTDAA